MRGLKMRGDSNLGNLEKRIFYHATTTGENDSLLHDFLEKGSDAKITGGYGQGRGFYVWTKLEYAQDHLDFILGKKKSDSPLVSVERKGYPLIVGVEGSLNPKDWDLDYEGNAGRVAEFIYDHIDLVNSIPDGEINFSMRPVKWGRILEKEAKVEILTSKIERGLDFLKNILLFYKIDGEEGKRSTGGIGDPKGDTFDAALLGHIFNYFQEHYPELTREAEERWFMEGNIRDLKYVGDKPLRVVETRILKPTGWEIKEYGKKVDEKV